MKLLMTMINAQDYTPLAENEYTENIFRSDENGYFQTHIYFRDSKKNLYIPAFSVENGYSLAFGANKDGTALKKFRRLKNNFYCDISEKDSLGLSVVGWTYIFILKDEKIIESHKLRILPDMKECAAMIRELIFIRRELFQKISKIHSGLSENLREKTWAEILENLNEQAEEIFLLMKKINARPRFGLHKFQQNCNVSKIRRFDDKIIRQYVIAPDRKKFQVSADKISMNIFENRLLKNKILRLKNFVETQTLQQKINAGSLQQDILAQISQTQKLDNENKTLAENMRQNLKLQLKKVQAILDAPSNKILECLNACLDLPVFKDAENKNEKWRMTQIFTNDANYRRAYLKLKELDEIFDFSFDADEKSFPAKKMYQIYEWWVLAKIVEFLIVKLHWKSEDDTPIEILRKLFNNLENVQSATISLTHENSEMKMEIFYNTRINESLKTTNCNLRPDYLFKVTANGTTKIFILDAKYRNYRQQSFKFWKENDLFGVCLEKYIRQIESKIDKKISMSFIVHSDKTQSNLKNFLGKYVVYNGTLLFENFAGLDGATQQIGSFYLLPEIENAPNQSEINLSLFFKMMFEYFMEKWEICWECGSKVEKKPETTTGGKIKYYMTCKECGAFWVKSHCGYCSNKLLIKHAINYHIEKKGSWLVQCPKCGG